MKKNLKDAVLLKALPDVPFDGWTEDVLTRACQRLRLSPAQKNKLFPDGVTDLVCYFSTWATEQMRLKMKKMPLAKMRIHERVTAGVRTRLEILTPHKEAGRMAFNFLMKPTHGKKLPQLVWHAADVIWNIAGDTSTDYNRYTKRLLLSGVLSSTTLYWFNDDSAGHENTWVFLSRRIENVLKIGKLIGQIKSIKEKYA